MNQKHRDLLERAATHITNVHDLVHLGEATDEALAEELLEEIEEALAEDD